MMAVLGALKMQRREYHRTCYRAIAQMPLAQLLAVVREVGLGDDGDLLDLTYFALH